ncbi:hypothetical protein MgSA37_03501 [Mucilaginibacter gotjawali]|uniref:Uncharacterized protein n=2 Tax=Mucilaginibacter gotjawali TaxID=1550579 RepID=A0A839SII5_9SPHI|nr:hypothetical protein [Mucilaginibacter gotjawali]BAU55319.1 hypothetical protein MgSA37_03501 [Mucilaginibacter gotjawali]
MQIKDKAKKKIFPIFIGQMPANIYPIFLKSKVFVNFIDFTGENILLSSLYAGFNYERQLQWSANTAF